MAKRKVATVKLAEAATRPAKKQRAGAKSDASSKDEESDVALSKLTASLKDALAAAKEINHISSSGIATLRRARTLATSVSKAIPEDPVVKQLDLEGHKKSINAVMKALLSSCKRDWHDGYETQSEYMDKISGEIAEWLPDIWDVLQTGEDIRLVRACIVYCSETDKKIWGCHTRAEYGEHDTDVSIMNEAGEVIYESSTHISNTLTWFWKELLIIDATPNANPLSSAIMEDLKKFDETEGVFAMLTEEPNEEDEDRQDRYDKHWTAEMRTTAKKLILQRQDARIEQFMKEPTLAIYTKIATDSLKPSLIEYVRKDLTQKFPKIPLGDAIEIFKRNGLVDDIVPLIPSIVDCNTLCSVVKILSDAHTKTKEKEKRKEYGEVAMNILKDGLTCARTDIMDEIENTFPALDEAKSWLENVVYAKYDPELLQKDSKQLDKAIARDISSIVSQFITKAAMGASDDDSDDNSDRYGYGSNAGHPDLSRPVLHWLQALGEWPNKAEAQCLERSSLEE